MSLCYDGRGTAGGLTGRFCVSSTRLSPPGATREVEDYVVNVHGVTVLELRIVPDISRGDARASLILLRLA